ncbi:protein mono-ADP-ribosyltransferase PARP4 isoform X1 [Piliocolobus tephrosceles]|uniref:protein mono-ADP-ribosyltransferase PARP4 isoform X1 n=2 Tax=Piliocolobus tephrosceles TaxID=591936 RepID=UPI000E6B42B0|nr:protein mono-ADP-ribosyltransferase PARP4 isoform X1 [Piliocolobus tephrosceles]
MMMGIFANCIFCLKVKYLPRQQKKKLQTDIKENGGKFSFSLNPQCTHVILDNADVLSQHQLNSIQKNHVHIANPDFIWESIREKKLLDVKNYDPNKPLDITPPPDQKASGPEVKTEGLCPDNATEEEDTVELTEFGTENVEIPHLPQDFEVAKYNTLEKVGMEGGQEAVVVELQCSRDSRDCPFLISSHFLLADGMQTRRQFAIKKTSEDASEYYENYIEELKKQGFLLREHFTPEATQLASEQLQALLLEEVMNSSTLSQEVSDLVEMIWAEALGHLEHTLLKPVNRISLNDVSKAEGILLLVKAALKNGETAEQLQKMMTEFYRLIPHKGTTPKEVNLGLLAKKADLCQLIRDMVNVCETNLSKPNPPSLAKYRALRCKIEHVEQNTEEFLRVRKEVLQNHHSKSPVDILQIFRVGRVIETTEFLSKLGNVRPFLHGSPVRNIVGILCRGLLLPKVVEDHGVQRTDVGNLGSGIYFSDSLSTSLKYSHPGETDGTRLLLICDVALGKCMDLHKKDFSLTEAPPGYDSVHGVSQTASVTTDFEDDEFVVYKTNQVKMKYIIKFSMPGDQIKDFHPSNRTELEEYRPEFADFSKVQDYQLPDAKTYSSTKAGLQDASGNLVPLEDVNIKGRIIDTVAQVIVFQTYTNKSHVPIEAKYIFPLDDKAAVCGFEAFINGKHIVGEIKEKEEAQREYREAVTQGHGAYLMSQDAPDVFTVSVGNLPPKAKVLIKITYITELSILGTVGVFFMPATVAPWQQDKALNENLQDTVEKICIKEIGTKQSFSLTMSIEMPYVIEFIFSDTHELKQKRTDCRAVISTMEGSSLDSSGFSLHISLSDAYLPRMWVEKHPEKESEACMLVFQPDLDVNLPDLANESEVIICLDCSSSMEGVTFLQAKQIALHALSLVGEKQKVNIIQFGTGYKELFSYPKHITSNIAATEFIMSATPTMGNTDFWKTLRYLSLLYPARGSRNILLVSDGHLQDESLTLQLVKRSRPHTRLFACGIGPTANRHILRILSQCGAGVFEYFNAKSKHSWRKQIEDQMTRLCSPSCHSVSVKWQQLNPDAPEALQAPAQVPSLFRNNRLLVYGFIPHCTQATLCALIQEKEFCTMVSTTELQKTTGTMIHKLAARALIRDYEDGVLHENETSHEMKKQTLKSLIIKLSKENSLITQFTSFVAVEKRDENESPFPDIPKVSELIAKEDVDILPYMSWQGGAQEAVTNQSLLASSEWQEVRSSKRKLRAKRKKKLSQPEVFEDVEVDGLGVLPAFTSSLKCGSVEKLLDLSWTESCKPTATEPLFRKVSQLETSTSSLFGVSAPAFGSSLPPAARPHSPAPMLFASHGQIAGFGFAPPPRQLDAPQFTQGPVPGSCADWIPQSASCPTGPPQNLPYVPFCGFVFSEGSLSSTQPAPQPPPLPGGYTPRPSAGTFPALDSPQLHFSLPTDPIRGFGSYHPSVSSPFHFQPSAASLTASRRVPIAPALPKTLCSHSWTTPVDLCLLEESVGSLEGSQCPDFCFQSSETESHELSEVLLDSCFLQIKCDTADDSIPCFPEVIEEDETVCTRHWQDAVPWTELFSLQTEDGFWKLTPELGLILNLDTNALHSFLKQKGIQSLGVKGRERLLDLIATMLVLQLIRNRLEKEGIVFKSLMKLDDASTSRNIPWGFEAIKKASEWVRRTEGQYPSICPRLELGKDWDSATKQLLGLQPINTVSPLHRVLHYSQG